LLIAADQAAVPGLIATLKGHTEAVYAVAFTPDARFVVTGSGDRAVKVWDAGSGKELKTFAGPAGHQNLVLSVAVSPDGNLIASGGSDNTAKIWDFPRNTPLREIANSEAVAVVAVSPDGTKLAGGGKDGTVRLWNIADGKELFKAAGHIGAVAGIAFNNNGQFLASAGADRTLRFWNPADGKLIAAFGAHAGPVSAVVFHPGANLAASAGADGVLKYWNVPPAVPRLLAGPHGDAVICLALSGDGGTVVTGCADKLVRLGSIGNGQLLRTLTGATARVEAVDIRDNLVAAGTADNRLLVWQAQDGKLLSNAPAHGGPVTSVAFLPNTNQLVTAGGDGRIRLCAMPPQPERVVNHPDAVGAAAVFGDGKRLVSGGADKVVRTWNLDAPQQPERQFSGHTAPLEAVAASPDGKTLASAGDNGVIRLWNLDNGQQAAILGAHLGPVVSLAFHGNGQLLSASTDGGVKLWQPAAAPPKLFAHPGEVAAAVLSADGSRLLTGCSDHQVRLWNLASGQVERSFGGHALGILAVAINAAGNQAASGSADKTVRVWDAGNAKELRNFAVPAAVHGVAFSPDGKTLAASLADGTIHLFDLGTGKPTRTLTGHAGIVAAVGFTPKGELVSAGLDKTVRVWLPAEGKVRLSLDHGGPVKALTLNKDGARVASGGEDKVVKIWEISSGKQMATFSTLAAIHGVSFGPDGTRLAVAGADNRARIYDFEGRMLEFFTHEGPVLAVAYHGDGKTIVAAGADKTARPWTLSLLWQGQHSGPVRQAVFARNDRVVSGGDDKAVKVWNIANGKMLRNISAHEGPVSGVTVSSETGKIASAGADKTVKLWSLDAPADKEEKPLVLRLPAAAQAVTCSPNGKRLAAATPTMNGTQVHVFDLPSGAELMMLPGHAGTVHSLAFLGDNRTLLSAGADKVVRLTDVNVLNVLEAHAGGVTGLAVHPNGSLIASGGIDKKVKLWNAADGKAIRTLDVGEPVRAVAFNRAGTQLAAAEAKEVKLWNVADGKGLRTLVHPSDVLGISFSSDGSRLAAACQDNQARLWDLADGRELVAFFHMAAVRAVICHPSSNDIVLTASADKTVAVHTSALNKSVPAGAALRRLAVLPGGSHFLCGDEEGKVKQWSLAGNADRALADAAKAVLSVAAAKNGQLFATGDADGNIRLYNQGNAKLMTTVKAPAAVRSLAFTPDSQGLVAVCDGGALVAWGVAFQPGQPLPPEFGKVSQTYAAPGVADLAFLPAGGQFFTGGAVGPVKAWKFAAEGPIKNLGHPNLVDSVAFSPDGSKLATGCHDGHVRVFDVAKGDAVKDINAHVTPMPASVYCVAWSPDGKNLVSGSLDKTLKLWEAASGKMLVEFKAYKEKAFEKGHMDGVYCLAFSPDGKFLASGGGDKAIKLWNVADGSVVREFANPSLKPPPLPGAVAPPPLAHPGYVYGVRFTPDGRFLVSAGGAPQNKGSLEVWNVADGKLLSSEELPLGTLFALGLSADGKLLALGTGGAVRSGGPETNMGVVLKLPLAVK
jgi:WD40 repeat protein